MKTLLATLLVSLSVVSLSLAQSLHPDDSDVLARAGSDVVKADDVRPLLSGLGSQQLAQLVKDPKALDQAVESIVVQRLVYDQALTKKWDQQPQVVQQLDRMRREAIIESYLASVSQPPADYPNEADIKSVYEANKAKLIVPRQYHVAQIYIALPRGADAATTTQAKGKADAITQSLAQPGADFAALAQASSDDKQSASHGGDLGWITESQIEPELRSHVLGLAKGAVSEPIQLSDGWHLLKMVDVKEPYTASLEEVHDQLVKQLRAAKARTLRQAYLAKLLQDNPVSLNPSAVARVLPTAAK